MNNHTPDAAPVQPTSTPPAGGSWRWDAEAGGWTENTPPAITPAPASE